MSDKTVKQQALSKAISDLEKTFGKGAVMRLGDNAPVEIESISTGSIGLDAALGIGGFPKGRIVEIWGPPSAGKTTVCLHAIAECQKLGGTAAFIDYENAYDPRWAGTLGVDNDSLIFAQPTTGEEGLEIAEKLISSTGIDIIVFDSVAAMLPKAELDGDYGDSVTFDTPVYVRNKKSKVLEIVPIKELYGGDSVFRGERHVNRYKKTKELEVLSHKGWTDLEMVFYKRNSKGKKTVITATTSGYVKTTPDHCLFVGGREAKPAELSQGMLLDVVPSPNNTGSFGIVNPQVAFLLGAWCGDGHIFSKGNGNAHTRYQYASIEKPLIDKIVAYIEANLGVPCKVRVQEVKGNRQPLYCIDTVTSPLIQTLLRECVAPKSDLRIVPKTILNNSIDVQAAFLEGFHAADGNHKDPSIGRRYYNNSLPLIAGVQYLLNVAGIKNYISFSANRLQQLTLLEPLTQSTSEVNSIRRIIETDPEEFIYDIQTKEGTFVTALGNIVLHNSKVGLHARLMSQAMRKLTGLAHRTGCCCIFINQLRLKIGIQFGNPETTTGGEALKFYASQRLDIRSSGPQIKDKDGNVTANHVKVKVVKNKLARPFCTAEFDIEFGKGISKVGELIDLGESLGFVEKSGSWYSYGGVKIGQGRDNSKQFMSDNPEVADELEAKIRGALTNENKSK